MSDILATPEDTQIQPNAHAPLAFEPQTYRHFLDNTDWTDAQKDEFISALWKIIVGFVDLGFGMHPVQQALGMSCGKTTLVVDSFSVVASAHARTHQQETAESRRNGAAAGEGIHDIN